MNFSRALLTGLLGLSAATGALAQVPAQAGDYPNKPVTLGHPFAAGSGPDAVLRLVSDKLSRLWNQRVVIDNKPGGGGFIAIDQARRAAPDGYTLLQLDSEHIAALPHLYKSKNFVTLQHFDPVASLFRTPFFVAVATDSKWKTMGDLIAAAKARARRRRLRLVGRGQPGPPGRAAAGGAHRHPHAPRAVPRGVAAVFERGHRRGAVGLREHPVEPGHLQGRQAALHRGGRAQAHSRRCPTCPPWPRRAGRPGLEVNSFVSLLAPKGVPAAVKAKINADVAKVIADPEIRARFDTFAFEPLAWSPEEIERNAEAKSKVYGELVRRGNISLD
jgi:tripartite-type tricarboxylate transporter receptor subunit TctC